MYTPTRLPVRLLYDGVFDRVEDAFQREKQVQRWGRAKRLALVHGHGGQAEHAEPKAKARGRRVCGKMFHVKRGVGLDTRLRRYSTTGLPPTRPLGSAGDRASPTQPSVSR